MKKAMTAQSYKFASTGFFMPFILVFVCFNLYPYAVSLFTSFYSWETTKTFALENMDFVQFTNYTNLLLEPNIKAILYHFMWYVPVSLLLIHSFSLILAKSIMTSYFRLHAVFLMLLFAPYMVSEDVLVRIFSRPFVDQDGWIVNFFNQFGVVETQTWLGQERRGGTPLWMGIVFLFFCTVIKYSGFFTLIYYMTLKSIHPSIIESAKLEGANASQVFFKIEFPMIRKMFGMMIVLSLIFISQSSQVQSWLSRQLEVERNALPMETFSDLLQTLYFDYQDVGSVSALTWVFVIIILVFISIGMISLHVIKKYKARQFNAA